MKNKIKTIIARISRRVKIRTWVALCIMTILLPIVAFKLFYKQTAQAAEITVDDSSTAVTIRIPGRYNAVLQKGDTTDYLQFYDRVQSDGSPSATHEVKGPCVTEAGAVYCLRDDAFRTTTILEKTSMRVRVRVYGRLNDEASTTYLTDSSTVYDVIVTEDYTFTAEGLFVSNEIDIKNQGSITLDDNSGHNGYEWLAVSADVTDGGFDDTGNILYGDGNTESTTSTDAGEFANTNSYVVLPGSDTYQDVFIGVPNAGWYDDTTSGVHEWHWDENISGTEDQISTQEQNYSTNKIHHARWFLLLKEENQLDTEAKREGTMNDFYNPDILSFTTGSNNYEHSTNSPGIFVDGTNDGVNAGDLSAFEFSDTDDFTIEAWFSIHGALAPLGCIVCKSDDLGSDSAYKLRYFDSSGSVVLTVTDGTDTYTITSSTIITSNRYFTWYHVAVVFDQDNATNSTMYINGVDDAPTKSGTIANVGALGVGAAGLSMGLSDPGSGNQEDFFGYIDEVRIWNTVRSASDIAQNMNKEIDPASSGLIGYWRFNENTGSIAEDLSATDGDASFVNNTRWATGKVPRAYNISEGAYTSTTSNKTTNFDMDAGSNVSTALNGALTDGATTVTVTSTSGFASSGSAYIAGGDKFTYTGTTSTTFTGVPSSGENAVLSHATGSVVSSQNRVSPMFKISGFQGTSPPDTATVEGISINRGTDFTAAVKPITDGFYQQDISFYAPMTSTSVDIGSNLTNSGCALTPTPYGTGSIALCTTDGADLSFTSTDNIDYTKGAIEFILIPTTIHTDGVERTYFNIDNGTDQFRLRKSTANNLEFLIDEGATTYTESLASSAYSWDLGAQVHIRLEWDDAAASADQMKIIINGTIESTTATGDFTGSLVNPGTSFFIGNTSASGTVECACGIDEFYIYDLNGSGNQAGRNQIAGASGGNALSSENHNQTLSFEPVDASGRGEYLYLGFDTPVNGVNFDLATNGASAGSLNLDWEYWNGSSWASLESISGFTDHTANLTRSGAIYWTSTPTNWRETKVTSIFNYYYIRASLNASSSTYSTSPIESRATSNVLEFHYLHSLTSEDQTFVIPTYNTTSLYWGMDEATGSVLNDGTGNKNDGIITNAVWRSTDMCIMGNCLEMDGSGDYVSRADDDDLDASATDSFTISLWFKHTDISSNPDYLITKHNSTAGGYKIYMDATGTITCGIDDDSTFGPEDSVTSGATYDDDRWHHVSCVKNASSSLTLYIDGQPNGTADTSFSATGSLENSDTFYLGIDGDGSSNGWDGFIDEVKYYPVARSAGEVKSDFIKGSGADRGSAAVFGATDYAFLNDGLLGYWTLDHSSGNATDSSGHSLTLTNNGTTTYAAGKFGNGSEHVPESSQYFSTATTISGVKTVSFWANPDSTTNYYLNLTNGAYITSFSGMLSATGFTSPTIYVNGVQTTSIAADTWQLVTVTTNTAIDANQLYIGRQNTNYYDGTMDETRLYNRVLSSGEIRQLSEWGPEPVVYYKLDEASWVNDCSTDAALDSSGNGYNADSCPNGTGPSGGAEGKYGSAGQFDGGITDDYLSNSSFSWPATGHGVTVSYWSYVATADVQDTSSFNVGEDDTHRFQAHAPWSDGTLYWDYGNSAGNGRITSDYTSYLDKWTHVALVSEGNNGNFMGIYFDGKLVASAAISDGPDTALTGIKLAAWQTYRFKGKLDDFRIYNYRRTNAQIVEDMNGGHPMGGSPVGSQIRYFKFDEQNGQVANDTVSNDGGELGGSTTSQAIDPSWKTREDCKINGCLDFEATDSEYVGAIGSLGINNQSFSLSAWAKRESTGANMDILFSGTSSQHYGLRFGFNSNNTFRCGFFSNDLDTSITHTDTNWHHYTCTYNATNNSRKIYVDGRLAAFDTATADFQGTGSTWIGANIYGASNFFDGLIDEVKIYGGELTAQQVGIDLNSGSTATFSVLGSTEASTLTGGAGNPPVVWMPLDENKSTTANDKSTNGYTGTLTGGATWQPGKIGSAVSFDGSDDYIDIGTGPGTVNTISFWAYPATTTEYFIDINGSAYISSSGGTLSATGFTSPTIYVNGVSSTTISANNWQHITVVTSSALNASDLDIGRIETVGNMQGRIDEVKIYDYVRTTAQIAYDYNRGGPMVWYKMDDCSDNTINDLSTRGGAGSGLDATLIIGASGSNNLAGNCNVNNSAAAWYNGRIGKFNNSLDFDGTDDYVSIPDTPATDFVTNSTNFSVSAWVYPQDPTADNQRILHKTESSSNSWNLVWTGNSASTDQAFVFVFQDGSSYYDAETPGNLATGQWYHIVGVRTGATSVEIWINGRRYTTDHSETLGGGVEDLTTIGTRTRGTPGHTDFFDGQIDDVRIYNYALSAAQIKNIMNDGSGSRFGPTSGQP